MEEVVTDADSFLPSGLNFALWIKRMKLVNLIQMMKENRFERSQPISMLNLTSEWKVQCVEAQILLSEFDMLEVVLLSPSL